MATDKITFLLNWRATPYHAPVYLAHSKGFFGEQGIKVALLEPNDPSDVTELIGSGKVDLGFKAMIHTLAAKARGYPIQAIGTLLDEPFTGICYLKGSGVDNDFQSLKGKRIGYVGEFGKLQMDELCGHFGMGPEDYTAVRCGMHISKAIINGEIDAGIGLENVQMVELEEWLKSQGRPAEDVQMLRIDELAQLGCCCFCSVLYIGNEKFLAENPEKVQKFMLACKKATDFMLAQPELAFAELVQKSLPHLDTPLGRKIFQRSFVYFSESLQNVERDWKKVTNYGKRLGLLDADFRPNYTNAFLAWPLPSTDEKLGGNEGGEGQQSSEFKQKMVGQIQRECARNGGFRRVFAME